MSGPPKAAAAAAAAAAAPTAAAATTTTTAAAAVPGPLVRHNNISGPRIQFVEDAYPAAMLHALREGKTAAEASAEGYAAVRGLDLNTWAGFTPAQHILKRETDEKTRLQKQMEDLQRFYTPPGSPKDEPDGESIGSQDTDILCDPSALMRPSSVDRYFIASASSEDDYTPTTIQPRLFKRRVITQDSDDEEDEEEAIISHAVEEVAEAAEAEAAEFFDIDLEDDDHEQDIAMVVEAAAAAAAAVPPAELPRPARQPVNNERTMNWFGTLNNYSADDVTWFRQLIDNDDKARYVIFGRETGEAGTPHLQFVICFRVLQSFRQVKLYKPRAHWEICRSLHRAIEYCKKEGDWEEFGDKPRSQAQKGEAEKERWREIVALAKAGELQTLSEKYPQAYLTQIQNIIRVQTIEVRNTRLVEASTLHYWFVGPTGTGKSLKMRQMVEHNREALYLKLSSKWWDSWNNEPVTGFEDVGESFSKTGDHCKVWLDRYPFKAEFKGGSMDIRPQLIVVTSNYFPEEIWPQENIHLPIRRRVRVVWFGERAKCNRQVDFFHPKLAGDPLDYPVLPELAPQYTDWLHARAANAVQQE